MLSLAMLENSAMAHPGRIFEETSPTKFILHPRMSKNDCY